MKLLATLEADLDSGELRMKLTDEFEAMDPHQRIDVLEEAFGLMEEAEADAQQELMPTELTEATVRVDNQRTALALKSLQGLAVTATELLPDGSLMLVFGDSKKMVFQSAPGIPVRVEDMSFTPEEDIRAQVDEAREVFGEAFTELARPGDQLGSFSLH